MSKPQHSLVEPKLASEPASVTQSATFQGEQSTSFCKSVVDLDNTLGTDQGKSKQGTDPLKSTDSPELSDAVLRERKLCGLSPSAAQLLSAIANYIQCRPGHADTNWNTIFVPIVLHVSLTDKTFI